MKKYYFHHNNNGVKLFLRQAIQRHKSKKTTESYINLRYTALCSFLHYLKNLDKKHRKNSIRINYKRKQKYTLKFHNVTAYHTIAKMNEIFFTLSQSKICKKYL